MPKRKINEMEKMERKLRKWEERLEKARRTSSSTSSTSSSSPGLNIMEDDWVQEEVTIQNCPEGMDDTPETNDTTETVTNIEGNQEDPKKSDAPQNQETAGHIDPQNTQNQTNQDGPSRSQGNRTPTAVDKEILEMLGEDPLDSIKPGTDIWLELAGRLQHIATEGLKKETRKELMLRYPIPGNCPTINAPKINPEIKAAIADTITKRNKGIEAKQKQMACAITSLAGAISTQITLKDQNNEILKKMLDSIRLLCDIQHGDSITRKNFILFSLKKDMKEHLTNTKIDSFLFGENLAETLKSAKAVNKSGVELKASPNKNIVNKPKTVAAKPLNRNAPPPPRGQMGTTQRSRRPAAYRATHPPAPYAHSSKPSPRAPQHPQRFRH